MNNCKDKLCKYYNENYSYNCTYTSNEENCVKAIKAIRDSKQMTDKRVIFESVEEAYEFCEINKFGMNYEAILWHVNELKKNGYIRRNPVELWDEMIEQYFNSAWDETYYDMHKECIVDFNQKLKLANEAIQYLRERQK